MDAYLAPSISRNPRPHCLSAWSGCADLTFNGHQVCARFSRAVAREYVGHGVMQNDDHGSAFPAGDRRLLRERKSRCLLPTKGLLTA